MGRTRSAEGQARKSERYRAWWALHREEHLPRMRRYTRAWSLMRRYGLTLEDLAALRKRQRGLCAMCGKRGRLQVDHSHEIGNTREAVRALVCGKCNHRVWRWAERPRLVDLLLSANPDACTGAARQLVVYLQRTAAA